MRYPFPVRLKQGNVIIVSLLPLQIRREDAQKQLVGKSLIKKKKPEVLPPARPSTDRHNIDTLYTIKTPYASINHRYYNAVLHKRCNAWKNTIINRENRSIQSKFIYYFFERCREEFHERDFEMRGLWFMIPGMIPTTYLDFFEESAPGTILCKN